MVLDKQKKRGAKAPLKNTKKTLFPSTLSLEFEHMEITIANGSLIKVTFHASSNDRVNDNGQFKTLQGLVIESKPCQAGTQYIIQTDKGLRSFTSAAKVRTLEVNGAKLVHEYEKA